MNLIKYTANKVQQLLTSNVHDNNSCGI